nr:NAD(P)-dependent oxidoreductase [uncultured Holophaga sp.]
MPQSPLQGDLGEILGQTRGLWESLRGARLFITGGTGFFGVWLLESLAHARAVLDLDCEAVVLTRDPEGFRRRHPRLAGTPGLSLHPGDVRDFAFPGGSFTHVIHAGSTSAEATFQRIPPLESFDTVVQGTRRVLDFTAQCGARRFLLTSSGAACGPQPPGLDLIPEDWQGGPDLSLPQSALGEGKRVVEWMSRECGRQEGFEVVVARCFSFVGPHLQLDLHYAIGNFIRDALAGTPIRVQGDGTPIRSFLYAADLAVWLWTLLLRGEPGRLYHVGSERGLSVGELAHTVGRVLAPGLPVEILGQRVLGPAPSRYVPATTRCREELGLRERVDLEEAIRRTADFARRG